MTASSTRSFGRMVRYGLVFAALAVAAVAAGAQERMEREGVVLYWGLVPSALVSQPHAQEDLHGGRPPGGGRLNHLVIALFDARSGARIDNAVVRAQLSEPGIVDAPAKYLVPMPVNGQASFGQVFGTVYGGPYRFRVYVQLQQRPQEIQFDFQAQSQLVPAGPAR
ncbi:hypothetical protein WG922_09540 [Ramlibacter sp. AN1015]|uniref:hypothetical protein n=1 Tax=Ramlibacter sp. AN1015 TaxID=3133428 RepID=UPI0030BECB21